MKSVWALVSVVLTILVLTDASPYNKYGRTCKDILCSSREECIMEHDPCTTSSSSCGQYPSCKRKASSSSSGCASMRCPSGHFCSIRQEACSRPPCQIKPTCIAFRTPSPNKASSSNVQSRPSSQNRFSYNNQYNRNSWSNGRV